MRTRSQTALLRVTSRVSTNTPTSRFSKKSEDPWMDNVSVAEEQFPLTMVDARRTPTKNSPVVLTATPTTSRLVKQRMSSAAKAKLQLFKCDKVSDENPGDWDLDKAVAFVEDANIKVCPFTPRARGYETLEESDVPPLPSKKKSMFPLDAKSKKSLREQFDAVHRESKVHSGKRKKGNKFPNKPKNIEDVMKFEIRFYSIRFLYVLLGCRQNSEAYYKAQKILARIFTGYSIGSNYSDPVSIDVYGDGLSRHIQFMFDAQKILHTRKFNPKLIKVHNLDRDIYATVQVNDQTTVIQVIEYCKWLFDCLPVSAEEYKLFVAGHLATCLSLHTSCGDTITTHGPHVWYLQFQSNILFLDRSDWCSVELAWAPFTLLTPSEVRLKITELEGNLNVLLEMDPHKSFKLQKRRTKIETKNPEVALSFYESDGQFLLGVILPLNAVVSVTPEVHLKSLLDAIQNKKGGTFALQMVVRTYNFALPGIGLERSFVLISGMPSVSAEHADFPKINMSELHTFLKTVLKHGRPQTSEFPSVGYLETCLDWSKFSPFHLEASCIGTPLVDDTKAMSSLCGYYQCETASLVYSLGQKRTPIKQEDRLFDIPFSVRKSAAKESLVREKYVPRGRNLFDAREELIKNVFGGDPDTPPITSTSLESVLLPAPTPAVAIPVAVLGMDNQPVIIPLNHPVLAFAPESTKFLLADPNFQVIMVGRNPAINHQFLITMIEWNGLPLGTTCRQWCVEHLSPKMMEQALDRFRGMPIEFQSMVLELDKRSFKPAIAATTIDPMTKQIRKCFLCRLPGLHVVTDCPLYSTLPLREERIFCVGRCAGCFRLGCQMGRVPHDGIVCETCDAKDHVTDACYLPLWSLSDATSRQQFIIGAMAFLSVGHVNFISREVLSAYERHADHVAVKDSVSVEGK